MQSLDLILQEGSRRHKHLCARQVAGVRMSFLATVFFTSLGSKQPKGVLFKSSARSERPQDEVFLFLSQFNALSTKLCYAESRSLKNATR